MLKVKTIKNVCFLGECDSIVTQLTCPFCNLKNEGYFYYKNTVYKISNDRPSATVICVSALDLVRYFEEYVRLILKVNNPILLISNKKQLRKFGLKIDDKNLSYSLAVPVISSRRPINRLLDDLHITASVPRIVTLNTVDLSLLYKSCIKIRRICKIFCKK